MSIRKFALSLYIWIVLLSCYRRARIRTFSLSLNSALSSSSGPTRTHNHTHMTKCTHTNQYDRLSSLAPSWSWSCSWSCPWSSSSRFLFASLPVAHEVVALLSLALWAHSHTLCVLSPPMPAPKQSQYLVACLLAHMATS